MQHSFRMITYALLAMATFASCSNTRDAAVTEPVSAPSTAEKTSTFGGATKGDSLVFSLERTPCFGPCKAYRISIYRSGFASFEGLLNMEKEGLHSARVGTDSLSLLLAKADELGFWTMKDKYDSNVTDLPSTYLRMVANGKDKKVMGRHGQPAAFKELVAYAEELLLPVAWKPVAAKP